MHQAAEFGAGHALRVGGHLDDFLPVLDTPHPSDIPPAIAAGGLVLARSFEAALETALLFITKAPTANPHGTHRKRHQFDSS